MTDERDRTLDEVERDPYEPDDREPCGENMCHCDCGEGHVCACDCWRCGECQQNADHCQCDDMHEDDMRAERDYDDPADDDPDEH